MLWRAVGSITTITHGLTSRSTVDFQGSCGVLVSSVHRSGFVSVSRDRRWGGLDHVKTRGRRALRSSMVRCGLRERRSTPTAMGLRSSGPDGDPLDQDGPHPEVRTRLCDIVLRRWGTSL